MGRSIYQPRKDIRAHRDRRLQATLVLLLVWGFVSLWHWLPQTQWLMVGLTVILAVQTLRMLIVKPAPLVIESDAGLPQVSILVPAKNESAVLTDLVYSLYELNYPRDRLDIWVIDDGSTDATPQILQQLQAEFPTLQVHQRESKGGKSGALNAVFPLTRGEIILVCDADALLPANFLMATVPVFQKPGVGAVQVRKAIMNAETNFLTRCQQMEMNCDSFLQTHRIAVGGMSELRGNGMLVRRELLQRCQGWSEDTVTDDLDLCFKLYLAGTEIEFVTFPTIQEEAVTTWKNLWLQHCRWAEGGYQRYLDYFPQILTLGWAKSIDLLLFFLLQFLLPIGLIPDLLWTIIKSDRPVLLPLQTLLSIILTVAFIAGIYQYQNLKGWSLLWATIQGSIYMVHWIPAMIVTTFKLCFQKPRSRWIKTEHQGRI
ncbi:glycosyl transferase family protein [Tolypothrix tenuis PCC 7101]|uniref:Beta-monoglucosyldiacylglycerol synthase n=1 Tax=Tolypothrix tenuis PCC 7101 TaxID=231146 RepID=A0A1Z4N9V2_9CYAN|nr:glycosyltransferase family 2 protein [Aulosira sp. FACHB-113]BAZ02500.1 glycosyl transferase family protein [Tolypothrix tenuis PCC 7101]BAZ73579.1 glycosyl transferase family protein [Aulosira laxa NIES-50]